MNSAEDLNHAVLQRLIMLALGLMFVSVLMTSCTYREKCAAYSTVDVEQPAE